VIERLKHQLRLTANALLLPALQAEEEVLVGGQAVIEGVMMRSPHAYCVAVRKPAGEMAVHTGELVRPSERRKIWKYPVLRGLATLGQALKLGITALKFSANCALEEEAKGKEEGKPEKKPRKAEISSWVMAVNLLFSLGFFIFLYKFVPLLLATELKQRFAVVGNHFVFNAVDGVIRLLLFLGFLLLVSSFKDIKRVFEYHGAEHKVVYNFESRQPLSVANARGFSTLHPRCGTSFLLVVMIISMAVYTLAPAQSFLMRFVVRIAFLPVIAGVSFELIRFAAKRQGSLWAMMVRPGLWLQKITTRTPADDQLEVAIHALNGAMALELQRGGDLVIA
jgi:uncharacterized protein YqhQ